MENNKKKRSFLGIVGTIMIIVGLGFIAWDFGTTYIQRKSIEKEMQDFFNAPLQTDDDSVPKEASDKDLWGMIQIDKLDINFPIIKSDDWSYLNRYLVAWEQSTNPPEKGNFSIAGHNGRCASCVFRNFDKLEKKDTIRLVDKENIYTYEIYDIFKVFYTDTSVLNETKDKTTVTLVTCTEQTTYDEYRTILKGELIKTEPKE